MLCTRCTILTLVGAGAILLVVIVTTIVLTEINSEAKVKKFNNGSPVPPHSYVTISPISSTTVPNITPKEEQRLRDDVLDDFSEFHRSRTLTPRLFGVLDQISLPSIFSMLPTRQSVYDTTLCVACRSVLDALMKYYESGKSKEEVRDLVYSMCTTLQIQTPTVCAGVIDLNLDSILYIFNHTEGLTSSRICAIVLQGNECSTDDPILEWTVDVDLGTKPKLSTEDSKKSYADEPLTIVQISDVHYDPSYQPNGNAQCGEPMCCRNVQGDPATPEAAAGYWGDYRQCDTSWHAFENALQQIKTTHQKIDYIYLTGDLVDHAVWDTSIPKNTETIKKITAELKAQFPDVPVFPVLGNHEPSPLNVYAPVEITDETISTNWLYELIAEQWTTWLPADTKETILKGGFYTTLARPGFRIVTLNNNMCYTFNWWLIQNPKDPANQLKWLAETLIQAEKDGEKVHILGHVPSGDNSCLKTWSREFHKIVDRFESTITGQFYGHTHNDQFQIFYALDEPTRANNVGFNGGSVTTFSELNSNYKVYVTDPASYAILDAQTWIFNLTEANLNGENELPHWKKLYSFQEDYGVQDLTPTELEKLTHEMAAKKEIIEKYSRYFVKAGDASLAHGCDANCLKGKLCEIARAEVGDSTQCNKLMEEFEANQSG